MSGKSAGSRAPLRRKPSSPPRGQGGRKAGDRHAQAGRQTPAERLEHEIVNGRLAGKTRLPTETVLAHLLGLSRYRLRDAVTALVDRGILRRVPHTGTFILPRRIELSLGATTRVIDVLREAGHAPGSRTLSRRRQLPPADVAHMLGIAARTPVVELAQLLSTGAAPLACVTVWLPADRLGRAGDIVETTRSLRRALAQIGVPRYRRKLVRISARAARADERTMLGRDSEAPYVLEFEGFSIDDAGEPTHAFRYAFDADRVALVVEPG